MEQTQTSPDNTQQVTEPVAEVSKNTTPQGTVESTTDKTYSQFEVDAIAAEIRRKAEQKVSKKFEGVDVEHYRSLIAKEENEKLQKQKEKGEFETILKEQAEKSQQRIQQLTGELTKIKVDGALINAASTMKAINPDQVTQLLRDRIKMSDTGEVEVVDPRSGQARYTEKGAPMSVQDAVKEFLNSNPHFVAGGPAGGGSQSNTRQSGANNVDVTKLDMNNPEHRKQYAEWRKTQGY
tara:strand:+ start:1628 stop:2338 length:711 start_codon:yes stop_codon:yes gene_type:complete